MPFAEHFMVQGTFTAPASLPGSINLNLGFIPTRFEIVDLTQLGVNSSAYLQKAYWDTSFGSTNALVEYITSSGSTLNIANVTSNAFTPYNGSASITSGNPAANVAYGPQITGTTITKANPAVCSATGHGLQTGDVVVFQNLAVMKQIGGMGFTVTVTGANSFTIPLNTSSFANSETAFKIRKVIVGAEYYPSRHTVVNITAASSMVVSTAAAHGLTVGQQVRVIVPTVWGMTQANNLQGIITAVTTQTLTLNINSSAFSAFTFPAATSVPFTFSQIIPIGSGPSPFTFGNVTYDVDVLDDATTNNQFQGITIGTNILQSTGTFVIAASDVFSYTAWRGDV